MAKLDDDNSGKLSFAEFLMPAVDPLKLINNNDNIWKILRDWDSNGSNSLTIQDV